MPFPNLAAQSAQSRPSTVKVLVPVSVAGVWEIPCFVSAGTQQSQGLAAGAAMAAPAWQQSQADSANDGTDSASQQLQPQVAAGSNLTACPEPDEQQSLWQVVFRGALFPDSFFKAIFFTPIHD